MGRVRKTVFYRVWDKITLNEELGSQVWLIQTIPRVT